MSLHDDIIIIYHRVVAATPIKTTAVSLPLSQYAGLDVEEQMEDLPEDEGMDDLELGLEEALQGTFTSQSMTTTDEKVDEGTGILLFVSCNFLPRLFVCVIRE